MLKRVLLALAALIAALVIIPAGYVGLVLWQAHGGVPDWSGEATIEGLEGTIEIVRDEHGVPHIFAETERDLAFAQGFVHAQDRFWQMALARQSSAGRLSEWFGASALRADRFKRLEGGEAMADRLWAGFPEAEKPLMEAYAAGVNAWLTSKNFRLPPEMRILHVRPEPWRPRDGLLVYRQVYAVLAGWGFEPLRARMEAAGSAPTALEMLQGFTRIARPIIGEAPTAQPTAPFKDKAFSDNWTLSGQYSASGRPLMANDPQLPTTLPNFWHLQHHSLPGRDVAGASIPGLPGIGVGHNGRIAWGVTNGTVDVNDIALLEIDPADPSRYRRGPNEPWETFQTREEVYAIRFGKPFRETVRFTPWGDVAASELLSAPVTNRTDVVAEWHLFGLDVETSPAAFLRINRAGNVTEALGALEVFSGPVLNISIADVDGNIGYVTAGRLPNRPETYGRTVGLAPDDSNVRTYVPYAENPRIVNPASGRIVTANQLIISLDQYPYYLSDYFAEPSRTDRVHELLDAKPIHDVESFRLMQSNTLSPPARRVTPFLLQTTPLSTEDAKVLEVLRGWDHHFDLDDPAPVAYLTWFEFFSRRVSLDELGPKVARYGPFPHAAEEALGGANPEWCDDATTEPVETCATLLSETLAEARVALEKAFGPDPAKWAWGDTQKIAYAHLGFADLPILGEMFSRRTPRPGGPESLFVNQVHGAKAPHFEQSTYAPSLQGIYDLAALDQSLFMLSGGQSGHFASPFYDNLTPLWLKGERIRIPLKREEIKALARFSLNPAGGTQAEPGPSAKLER